MWNLDFLIISLIVCKKHIVYQWRQLYNALWILHLLWFIFAHLNKGKLSVTLTSRLHLSMKYWHQSSFFSNKQSIWYHYYLNTTYRMTSLFNLQKIIHRRKKGLAQGLERFSIIISIDKNTLKNVHENFRVVIQNYNFTPMLFYIAFS